MRRPKINSSYEICFVALPYATAKLHIGRIMGSFLPADIYKRYLWDFHRKRCYLVSGLDCYGTSVYLNALELKIPPKKYCELKEKEFSQTLARLSISLRYPFKTLDLAHQKFTRKYLRSLIQTGRIGKLPVEAFKCDQCGFLIDRLLEDIKGRPYEKLLESHVKVEISALRCALCKAKPKIEKHNSYCLNYIPYSNLQYEQFKKSVNLVEQTKEVSRFFTQWGLKGDAKSTNQLNLPFTYYVWIEALLSYYEQYLRVKKLNNKEPDQVKYFFAKDNYYYHSIILSQLIPNTPIWPLDRRVNLINRNYVLASPSEKMSSSVGNLIGVQDLTFSRDLLRYALAASDPYGKDCLVDQDSLTNHLKFFQNKYVNLVKRAVGLLKNTKRIHDQSKIDFDPSQYHKAMRSSQLIKALLEIHTYQKRICRWIDQKIKSKQKISKADKTYLYSNVRAILFLLKPYVPNTCDHLIQVLKGHTVLRL